ncbi:uncharacterized protein TNIN_238181 [Trichonephila inaurata madagascariensis]|uniref:Uncharacterized protein n=1 Tax=Trichonephila inaurata madagascariensis TaxID=2747483 RepID=A0A8X7CC63_9ARAC|nr:uncharacterized protein TNIN_238181 [Trichonephila inaurata madagascariensis]
MYSYIPVVLFLFFCFGPTTGNSCECISYLIAENGLSKENKIASIEYNIEDLSCDGDGVMKCKDYCVEMYEELTENGKICTVMPGDNRKIADWMCEALKQNVCNARVGVFVQSCGSDPVDTGFRFHETLCCKSQKSTNC